MRQLQTAEDQVLRSDREINDDLLLRIASIEEILGKSSQDKLCSGVSNKPADSPESVVATSNNLPAPIQELEVEHALENNSWVDNVLEMPRIMESFPGTIQVPPPEAWRSLINTYFEGFHGQPYPFFRREDFERRLAGSDQAVKINASFHLDALEHIYQVLCRSVPLYAGYEGVAA
ncbi:hypothetical protein VUR80DRAFT_9145 [Thermomyces stellatus]